MRKNQRVANMADEVLARQARDHARRTGESFEEALEAVLETEAGGSTPVPEAWIGQPVELIFVSGSSAEYNDGYLEEVNERGIVLTVEGHGEHLAQPLFFPWGAVIQLSEASDG